MNGGPIERAALAGRHTKRYDLSWSPDGRFVAYIDGNAEVEEVTQLFVLRFSERRSP